MPRKSAAGTASAKQPPVSIELPTFGTPRLERGSTATNVLEQIYRGAPYVCVEAPPGGGKSHLVKTVTEFLVADQQLSVVVASPTKKSVKMLVDRIAENFKLTDPQIEFSESNARNHRRAVAAEEDPSRVPALTHREDARVVATTLKPKDHMLPDWVVTDDRTATPGRVMVTTVAAMGLVPMACDVLFIDEAFQVTFADAVKASNLARQVVFVGDPGQIGPVVTARVDSFSAAKIKPDIPAPLGFSTLQGENPQRLPSSYRLGAETVQIIQPLYDFSFYSSRPDRFLMLGSEKLPEVVSVRLQTASMPDADEVVVAAVDKAQEMLDLFVYGEGEEPRQLSQEDVAIVVSHNSQQAAIAALLNSRGLGEITVNTADSLQGSEWEAVVALDPFIGYEGEEPSSHQVSSGRLCVMASRHRSHLVYMHDGAWESGLMSESADAADAERGREVRAGLTRREERA